MTSGPLSAEEAEALRQMQEEAGGTGATRDGSSYIKVPITLATEVSHGRVVGPFTSPPFTDLYITRFGVVPKRNLPGKWCLSLDLSSPDGHSVDDGIPKISFQSSTLQLTPVLVASWPEALAP